MPALSTILLWTQIVTSILLITAIILQQKSAGLGSAMGGGGGEHFASHRGVDKILTIATILFALIFFGTALGYLFV